MAVSDHGRGADQVSLRLPPGMRERIKEAARLAGRSMNAQIIATLEEAYPDEKERLRAAIRTIDEEIARSEDDRRDMLVRMRNDLLAELWSEAIELHNPGSEDRA